MENHYVACPIVYGSIAFYLGKKAEEFNTHRWTLFVRGPNDDDLSIFVEKAVFTLHPSFQNPVRSKDYLKPLVRSIYLLVSIIAITHSPYEITETGWGEFEASIRLFFRDPDEQPIDLFHQIRLYPPIQQQQLNVKKVRLLVFQIVFLFMTLSILFLSAGRF
jgi:YEATS domain-containing protein 4